MTHDTSTDIPALPPNNAIFSGLEKLKYKIRKHSSQSGVVILQYISSDTLNTDATTQRCNVTSGLSQFQGFGTLSAECRFAHAYE